RITVAGHTIIRTKAHPALHRRDTVLREIKPFALDQARLVVALQNKWRRAETIDRPIHRRCPVRMRKVAAQKYAARSPRVRRKAGDFEDEVALFLGQALELLPISEAEFGSGAVWREWRGIDQHRVWRKAAEPA